MRAELSGKINKTALITAFIHWLITFGTDRLVFTYRLFDFTNTVNTVKTLLAWGAKAGFLIVLIILWQLIFYAVSQCRDKNVRVRQYIWHSGLYLAVMSVFFILLAPGLWRMDEFGILKNAVQILPHFWQGYLTSVFYIIALMLIPNPMGVVFVQLVVISLITGYIVSTCGRWLHNKGLVYAMYIPFLLFPVIDSNFYPIRMSIYAFLELLFVFELFAISYEKRRLTLADCWLLAALAGVLVCWRTESVYYIVLAPAAFLVLFHQTADKKKKWLFVLLVWGFSFILSGVQLLGNRLDSGDQYDITAVVLPITPLAAEAARQGEVGLLDAVDKVLDTSILLEGASEGRTGIAMFWSEPELVRTGYTDAEYSAFKAAYYKLILKYPGVFLKERFATFTGSTGLLNETELLLDASAPEYYRDFVSRYKVFGFKNIRSSLIGILEALDHELLHNLMYSFIPQAVLLAGTCILWLVRRRWGLFLLGACLCAKLPLIFLTAPSRLFMYYYGIYLAGSVWLAALLIFYIDKKKG